jgi:hypothetical protein
VFGTVFLAGLTISSEVERAVANYRLRRTAPPVAGPEQIDAQLDAFIEQIFELTAPGRDVADLDEALAHACARAEEWTA